MNLDFSDDQRMLKDSIDRFIAGRYGFEQRASYARCPDGWSRAIWTEIAEMGLTMLPFEEADGGMGLGGVETMIVGEAFGRGLVLEPYLPSVVLAGTAIRAGASAEQRGALLPALLSGEAIFAFADRNRIMAVAHDAGWRLSGKVDVVLGGDVADTLIVRAEHALFVVPADTPGLVQRNYRLHGGGGAADIYLRDVAVGNDGRLDDVTDRIIEAGIAFVAAEAVGALQAALDMTTDYLKTREQFGKPIGTNQALQHRAAEMLVEVEQARSAAMYAALLSDEPDADERARGFAAVKIVIGKAARFVGQQAIQLHGGIGVSEEYAIGHYFRRLTAIELLFGDSDHQIARLASIGGFGHEAR